MEHAVAPSCGVGRPLPGPAAALLVSAAVLLAAPEGAPAQEAGGGEGGEPSCVLRWASLTDSTGSRSIETGPDRYRHHVWNGMRWTCGDAVMTADSAVQFPGDRVEMVGGVTYRDTVRTLDARRLTYFQTSDLIEARESVRVVRRATGSTLEAPAVDFYRAGSGEIRQTVATGGTRMTVVPPDDTAGATAEPYHVTSDRTIILQDEVTIARGDVVITRQDFRGTGAMGRFDPDGHGLLTGDPVLTGEDYRLSGDTVRTLSREGSLREVRAVGSGRLQSEGMDVRAPEIRIGLDDGDVRDLWAYGGNTRSRSASRVMLGDSLHMVFGNGRPDTITAVGEAAALELEPGQELPDRTAPTPAGEEEEGGEEGEEEGADDPSPADPEAAEVRETSDEPDAAAPLANLFSMERDWIRGDTVRARFARPEGVPADSGAAPSDSAPGGGPGEAAGPGGDDEDPDLRSLTARGSARAYYRVTRDTARDRRGRNYLVGREVVVEFREGEPHRVLGLDAIGVYLEPAGPGSTSTPGPLPSGRGEGQGGAPGDTAAADTTARPGSRR